MKTWLCGMLLCLSASAQAQVMVVVTAPPDATTSTQVRMPNGFTTHAFLRGHMILPASELAAIPAGTTLSMLGMVYIAGTDQPAGGAYRLWLENTSDTTNLKSTTWSTAVASMSPVYDGPLSLPVGAAAANVDLALEGAPFVYSGQGLYVAWEYVGAIFATSVPATYAANSSLLGGTRMDASQSTMPTTLTQSSAFRPALRLGYPNPYDSDLSLESLGLDYHQLHALWDDRIAVRVGNRGAADRPISPVTITVSGANASSQSLDAGFLVAGETLELPAIVASYPASGAQTITAEIGLSDENAANDERSVTQAVGCELLSRAGSAPAVDGIGFGTGGGILAVRYDGPAVPVIIDSVMVSMYNGTALVGKPFSARVLDADGAIVAQSDVITLANAQLGTDVSFPLIAPLRVAPGSTVYAGLLQTASTDAQFPVATSAPLQVPAERVYSFLPTGGLAGSANHTDLGMLKIGLAAHGEATLVRTPADDLIAGSTAIFDATPGYDDYRFLVNGEEVQRGTSAQFSFAPEDGDEIALEAMRGPCAATTSTTLEVLPVEMFGDGFEDDAP